MTNKTRRAFFTRGIAAVLGCAGTVLCKSTSGTPIDIPVKPYELSLNPKHRKLQHCGSYDYDIAMPAWTQIVKEMEPNLIRIVAQRTQLPVKIGMAPYMGANLGAKQKYRESLHCIDLGCCMDWRLEEARNHNWSAVQDGMTILTNRLIEKINMCKTSTSYIREINLYTDPNQHRCRRFGCYAWMDLENSMLYEDAQKKEQS